MQAPDTIDPPLGWRIWDVVELDGALRLCSLTFWTIWLPGQEVQATCRRALVDPGRGSLPGHPAPDEACTCGVYATRTARQAIDYARRFRRRSDTLHRVAGTVSLWGTVVEAEGGWRGERAYPARLVVPSLRGRGRRSAGRTVETIALGLAGYGVPVEIVDCRSMRELAAIIEMTDPGQ